MRRNLCIVIPTYNERDNIEKLVNATLAMRLDAQIIIVDDHSPDGTGAVADALATLHPQVTAIHRGGKGGRGSATIEGFKKALFTDAEYIVEMDADFSHDPADLPLMLKKAQTVDVVVASRYHAESHIVKWNIFRKLLSRFANLYAHLMLGIPITDYTDGYRCYRRAALASVDFDQIKSSGFIVLTETACQIHRKGFRFGEVPIRFVDRERGMSNLSWREVVSAFFRVLALRWRLKGSR